MKIILSAGLLLVLGLSLTSCLNTEKEVGTTAKDPRATYTPPTPSERTRMTSATVLNTVQATHVFSDPARPDRFVLQLRGIRVLSGQLHLFVLNAAGDTLRHEVVPARVLLNAEALADPAAASSRDKEIAILKGMNTFFNPEHFVQPAVSPTAEQPAEFDAKAWKDLQGNPATVALEYPGRDGLAQRLVFSKVLNKVLVVN